MNEVGGEVTGPGCFGREGYRYEQLEVTLDRSCNAGSINFALRSFSKHKNNTQYHTEDRSTIPRRYASTD